jgi:hypothetical protein
MSPWASERPDQELRTLLDSDIIKARSPWARLRRLAPLSAVHRPASNRRSISSSLRPGTNKKNATDIRLAVDATELVFTAPRSAPSSPLGSSDFSSLASLKEYGKYVIGVGIRESASDLLIQNCDEYSPLRPGRATKKPTSPRCRRSLGAGGKRWRSWWNGDVCAPTGSSRSWQIDQLRRAQRGLPPFSKFVSEAATGDCCGWPSS